MSERPNIFFQALKEFLGRHFTQTELLWLARSFSNRVGDVCLTQHLPDKSCSSSEIAGELADLIRRHGMVDEEFFSILHGTRSRLRSEIDNLVKLWRDEGGVVSLVCEQPESNSSRIRLVLDCEFSSFNEAKMLEILKIVRDLSGDKRMQLETCTQGSVKLVFCGKTQSVEKLHDLIEGNSIAEIAGLRVLEAKIVSPYLSKKFTASVESLNAQARTACGLTTNYTSEAPSDGKPEGSSLDDQLKSEQIEIDGYLIRERVGRGGMAVVYRAIDRRIGREVALKIYRRVVWSDEVRTASKLCHPNVVTADGFGWIDGLPYVVMPFVSGPTLNSWLQNNRTFSEMLEVFVTLADALQALHDEGVVHGNFKPTNVLIDRWGPKLIFGKAPTIGELLRGGTLEIMPVELLELFERIEDIENRNDEWKEAIENECPTPEVDQFSFFISLFRAFCTFHPFGSQYEFTETLRHSQKMAPSTDVVRQFRSHLMSTQRQRSIRWPNGELGRIPRGIRKVIARGLDPDPESRYADMNAVKLALRRSTIIARRVRWFIVFIAIVGIVVLSVFLPLYILQ